MTNKTMFIADTTKIIKDTNKHPIAEGMIEKLDEMLTEYGVTHFFTLPINSTNGIANDDEDCLNVFYDSRDGLTFNLVYMLWCKAVRCVEDDLIYRVCGNIAEHK